MNIDWTEDKKGKSTLIVKTDSDILMGSAKFNRSNNFTTIIVKNSKGKNIYGHTQCSQPIEDEINLAQREILKDYKIMESN